MSERTAVRPDGPLIVAAVRLPRTDLDNFDAAAKHRGLTRSEFLRRVVAAAIEQEAKAS